MRKPLEIIIATSHIIGTLLFMGTCLLPQQIPTDKLVWLGSVCAMLVVHVVVCMVGAAATTVPAVLAVAQRYTV